MSDEGAPSNIISVNLTHKLSKCHAEISCKYTTCSNVFEFFCVDL